MARATAAPGAASILSERREYWMAIVRPQNFEVLKTMGFKIFAATQAAARRIHQDDMMAMYCTGKGITGIFRVTGAPQENTSKVFAGRSFPFWIPIEATALLETALPIQVLVQKLGFITNKQRYGVHLQAQLIKLNESDFNVIQQALATVSNRVPK